MSERGQEREIKFYVLHLDRLITRLQDMNARLAQPRVLETNLRFDLPDGSLRTAGRVLRLRRDTKARLTYKGAGQSDQGILDRQEIEFVVDNFEMARKFLEALGYQQSMVYEKYRTTYEIDDVSVMLDELPYGNFVEIEGETNEQIQTLSQKLHLDKDAAIGNSYAGLFDNIRKALQLSFQDLIFENFTGIQITADQLGVRPADQ
ncbi:MAG TPA: class IV adenylate cyclase [Anaerolineales bacterium]|nr:class IV adenylate cyclase [Anaerolineales bacterium]